MLLNTQLSDAAVLRLLLPLVLTVQDVLDYAERAIGIFVNLGMAHPNLLNSFRHGVKQRLQRLISTAGMSDGVAMQPCSHGLLGVNRAVRRASAARGFPGELQPPLRRICQLRSAVAVRGRGTST